MGKTIGLEWSRDEYWNQVAQNEEYKFRVSERLRVGLTFSLRITDLNTGFQVYTKDGFRTRDGAMKYAGTWVKKQQASD